MQLSAAVVGLGAMGRHHVRVLSDLKGVRLTSVADVDPLARERVEQVYQVKAFGDFRELISREKPDLICVAVPTNLHKEVALAAIEQGCHVFIEKPIATTVMDGEEIISAATSKGVKLTVGHIERFNPAVKELKSWLSAGKLGAIYQVHCRRVGPFPARVRDVGVVIDLATHDIDILYYLLDSEAIRVYAEIQRRIHTEHEDSLSGLIRFASGVVGVLDVNWLTPTKIRELSICGERGLSVVNYLTQDMFFYENSGADVTWDNLSTIVGVAEGSMVKPKIDKVEPLKAELEAFVEAILLDRVPVISGRDALRALRLAHCLIDSARQGCPIAVSPEEVWTPQP